MSEHVIHFGIVILTHIVVAIAEARYHHRRESINK